MKIAFLCMLFIVTLGRSGFASEPTIINCQFDGHPPMIMSIRGGQGANDNTLQIGDAKPVELTIGSGMTSAEFNGKLYFINSDSVVIGDDSFAGGCGDNIGRDWYKGITAGPWVYGAHIDEMRGKVTNYASVDSSDRLDFQFPYQGGAMPSLFVRWNDGLEIFVKVDKGQFRCDEDRDSTVYVKFDAGQIQTVRCSEASDGIRNVIFLDFRPDFWMDLKYSQIMTMEASFFGEGPRQFKFNVGRLDLKKLH